MNDAELLQRFVREDSQAAFAELVRRHVDLVFSAARRQLGDAHLAEEVTQSVFCLLARKATELTGCVSLSGWLYRSTGNLAAQALRTELRRRRREQEAATMPITDAPSEDEWARITPHLDRAMQQLGETDRHAVLLRYFERKPMRDVGEALGISEAAAKMRVGRALDRLRALLVKQGAAGSAAALGALLSAQAVQAAPTALVSGVLAAASSITAGTAVATSLTTPLALMAKLNLKTVGIVAVALALVGGGTHLLRQQSGLEEADGKSSSGHASNSSGRSPASPDATELASPHPTESSGATALEQAKAQLRAALQIPMRTGLRTYPSKEVVAALEAFGPQRKEAFSILMDAFGSANEESKRQSIAVMGMIAHPEDPRHPGEPATGVRPLLMGVLMTDDRFSDSALTALVNAGLEPADLPDLALVLAKTQRIQLQRYIPEHIAHAASLEPDRFRPHLQAFRDLMDCDDPQLRFRAANALSATDVDTNPQVLANLALGLRFRSTSLEATEALDALARLGPKAKPVLDEVLAYARDCREDLKPEAFKTIGAIDSSLRHTIPGVDQELKKAHLQEVWTEKVRDNSWTTDDVRIVLQTPGWTARVVDSAGKSKSQFSPYFQSGSLKTMVSHLGDSAGTLLPDMLRAMSGLNDGQREELQQVIKSIDPGMEIARVASQTIFEAAQATLQAAPINIGHNQDDPLIYVIADAHNRDSTWRTEQEVVSIADKLASRDPKVHAAFVSSLLAKDPSLRRLFPEEPPASN